MHEREIQFKVRKKMFLAITRKCSHTRSRGPGLGHFTGFGKIEGKNYLHTCTPFQNFLASLEEEVKPGGDNRNPSRRKTSAHHVAQINLFVCNRIHIFLL